MRKFLRAIKGGIAVTCVAIFIACVAVGAFMLLMFIKVVSIFWTFFTKTLLGDI